MTAGVGQRLAEIEARWTQVRSDPGWHPFLAAGADDMRWLCAQLRTARQTALEEAKAIAQSHADNDGYHPIEQHVARQIVTGIGEATTRTRPDEDFEPSPASPDEAETRWRVFDAVQAMLERAAVVPFVGDDADGNPLSEALSDYRTALLAAMREAPHV